MATAGDGTALYGSGGAGEKLHKRPIQTDEGGNSAATERRSELEDMLKQVVVTMSSLSVSRIPHSYLHPTATMENLPDDLLINIFIRLLAKQLAQMRCVSKSWNVLLSDPSFVKSHLQRSIRDNNQQILLAFPITGPITQYSCKSPNLVPTNLKTYIRVNVIGSVNGLICLSDISYSYIYIWNPSLFAVSAIPLPHSLSYDPPYLLDMRFGFDPKTDDYKLVKILGVCESSFNVKEWLQVEVYSMRKGSWEFIKQPFPSHTTCICKFDDFFLDGYDGLLHWESKSGSPTERMILAFNLGSETFREIALPHPTLDSNYESHYLGILGGKLCEMSWCKGIAWEVWVMEEYGVPESWVRRHVFSQFKDDYCLYGFTSRNELLLIDRHHRLVLYDPIANKTKCTRTEVENVVFMVMEYVDSLVWV